MPRIREYLWDSWARQARDQIFLDAPEVVAVDTETSGVAFYDEPFAATLSWRSVDGTLRNAYFGLEGERGVCALEYLRQVLRFVPTWVLHNAKFDMQKLLLVNAISWEDIDLHDIEDTQTIFHLLDENSPKGLKKLAVSVLGIDDTIEVEIKSGKNKGQMKRVPKEQHHLAAVRRKLGLTLDDGYFHLPREVVIPYALKDTDFTLLLYEALMPRLLEKDESLRALYAREIELMAVLLRMEGNGLALDLEYLDRCASVYGVKVMEGWQRVVELTGNEELNPQSPKQLLAEFELRGLHLESTNEATLKVLDDELAQAILAYRLDKKLYTTYLSALRNEHRDGIIHPNFNASGARTGRMSSGAARA